MSRPPSADSLLKNMKERKEVIAQTDEKSFVLPNMSADLTKAPTIVKGQETADVAYIPLVLYGTDATPPTASNFPIGTIYIQYTP